MKNTLSALSFVLLLAAAPTGYEGTWKIESATVAPWWAGPGKPDAAPMKEMVGRTFTVSAKGIAGPGVLACAKPKMDVIDMPSRGLFEGAFDEMARKDPKADPDKLAAAAGFRGKTWKTLRTECGLDIHFAGPRNGAFGLDNWVFQFRKQ